jgi:hypothetical protein
MKVLLAGLVMLSITAVAAIIIGTHQATVTAQVWEHVGSEILAAMESVR